MTESANTLDGLDQQRVNPMLWLGIIGLIYLLLVAVATIGTGFKTAAKDDAETLFAFATNPFLGLIIGTLATALIQSSSTVTSIIVGLVAGGLPVSIAIPMVMGANIGTTITNTIVSLGHVRDKHEFRQAFSAATVHDFFNLLSVVVFLPLEIATGFLQKSAGALVGLFSGDADLSIKGFNFMKPLTKPGVDLLKGGLQGMGLDDMLTGVFMVTFGIAMILFAVIRVGRLLRSALVGKAKNILHAAIGSGPMSGIGSGTLVTILVQSSSTTTSLMVPLAGSGVFKTKDIYPFTLGANIGTCVTALLAATAVSGAMAGAALQIALVHLIYNVLGVLVIFLIPNWLRASRITDFPIRCAETLAGIASERKSLALSYILGVFFLVPGAMVFAFN
ncbi:MAG: Na/Pi symporter [Pseudomonadota bacterium]|nr:Na/Pi symporter [Pseudomonadota bacterium]